MSYLIWLILAIVFLAIEFGTVTLISLWFVGGSVAAMIVALCGGPLWLQILVFAIVSLILLLLVRPFLRKYINPKNVRTNVDAIIGKQALVCEAIDNLSAHGAVRINGVVWTARTADGKPVPIDSIVTVQAVDGVKLIVSPAAPENHSTV